LNPYNRHLLGYGVKIINADIPELKAGGVKFQYPQSHLWSGYKMKLTVFNERFNIESVLLLNFGTVQNAYGVIY
jgi:hypothetical protein